MVTKRTTSKRGNAAKPGNENARKLVLAGLGAVSLVRKRGEQIVETLVDEGADLRQRGEKFATTIVRDVRRAANDTRKQLRGIVTPVQQRARKVAGKIESNIAEQIGTVLGRLGVPSKRDIAELVSRVDELNRQVKSSMRKRAA